jgi:hypothetical protein
MTLRSNFHPVMALPALALSALSPQAIADTYGPGLDLRAPAPTCITCTNPTVYLPTLFSAYIPGDDPLLDPFGTFILVADLIAWTPHLAVPTPLAGLGFISSGSSSFRTGTLTVTTLYGIDAFPGMPSIGIRGFDAGELVGSFSDEQITGNSGHSFQATVARTVTGGELRSVLGSEFDLRAVAEDSSSVYFMFQTQVPAAELLAAVPEPSTYALFAGGLALFALKARRRAASGAA